MSRASGDEQGEAEMSEMNDPAQVLLCDKCIRFSKLTRTSFKEPSEGQFANLILGHKTIEHLLSNCFQDPKTSEFWSTAKNLTELTEEADFRQPDGLKLNLFDHYILFRFWTTVTRQALKRKLHIDVYKQILKLKQVCLFFEEDLVHKLNQKIEEGEELAANLGRVGGGYVFKEVFNFQHEYSEQGHQFNVGERKKCMKDVAQFKSHPVIVNETANLYNKLLEANSIVELGELYKQKHVSSEVVKKLLNKLKSFNQA